MSKKNKLIQYIKFVLNDLVLIFSIGIIGIIFFVLFKHVIKLMNKINFITIDSSIHNVINAIEIIHSWWFIIIVLFFAIDSLVRLFILLYRGIVPIIKEQK